MSKYLVIVESPTKARTISSILGKDYEVVSSMGHIVDLPSKKLSVDVENDFQPSYKVIKGKEKILAELKKKAENKERIYLATDLDREGEAISWHIKEQLLNSSSSFRKKNKKSSAVKKPKRKNAKKALEENNFYRIIFHEITKDALLTAIENPIHIDQSKVNAQTARRVLDRVVGYSLSPLLWKKIVRGLSAGRVQSITLKFIVEREKEIQAFIPKITYSIEGKFSIRKESFRARLDKFQGEKTIFENKEAAQKCIEILKAENFSIKDIIKKQNQRKPLSPYTTSLLQQDAFSKLRFSSQKTMLVAQKLYEGIKIDDNFKGLITYMRTDSFHISPKAKEQGKEFILNTFGQEYLPEKDHHYKEKKGAQLAHEAIHPTDINLKTKNIEEFLTADESNLYDLIWRRFTASLMHPALYENTKAHINSNNSEFISDGRRLIFDGFLKVWAKDEIEDNLLPFLEKGDELTLDELEIIEHITKPPPRFNDASLVKLLEEKGIGRPSTYAPTVYTLVYRNYIQRERGSFIPTNLGTQVATLLMEHFPKIMDENFTANMENELDEVEENKMEWKEILRQFYPAFKKNIENASNVIQKTVEYSDKHCSQCQGRLVIKWSRKGRFLSCENFPQCRYAENITTEIVCPQCKEGKLIQRRNKRGQFFYGCNKFPDCRFTSRALPKEEGATADNTGQDSREKPQE